MYVYSSFKIGEPNLLKKKDKLAIWLAYNKTQSEITCSKIQPTLGYICTYIVFSI